MSQETLCRLCINTCQAHKRLYDENGHWSEAYQIMVQYFHPTLFDATHQAPLDVMCLECWSQISNFHNFQQSVIQAQKTLLINAPQTFVDKFKVESCPVESSYFQQQTDVNESNRNVVVKYEDEDYSNEMQTGDSSIKTESGNFMSAPKLEIIDVLSEDESVQDYTYVGPHNDTGGKGTEIYNNQDGSNIKKRKKYKTHSHEDKITLVNAASRGDDWVSLASALGVNYNTAYGWISSGSIELKQKGGMKPKKLTENHVAIMLSWLEKDNSLTLGQLKEKILKEFNISVTPTTVGNYLEGRLYSSKRLRPISEMNSCETKESRENYVRKLNEFVQEGKQIAWMGETNFNLFCRNSRGRSRIGQRDVQQLPAARGPNINLMGVITTAGVLLLDRQRGPFTSSVVADQLYRVFQKWTDIGQNLNDLVIVCDNAPCYSSIEIAVAQHSAGRSTVLRLSLHSSMLNPTEYIWSKISLNLRKNLYSLPNVSDSVSCEDRLLCLEKAVDEANATITEVDCAMAVEHSKSHHAVALSLDDMHDIQTTH